MEAAVARVISTGGFILGPAVEAFESAFAAYCGRRHCIAVNSGTSGLHLALLGARVGPGDEVITSPHGWISTAWAIRYVGARPVFADVDQATGNLDPDAAEAAIGPATRAIIAVDLYGGPADHGLFEQLAARHGITLIEDAAQAHGATLRGRSAGSFGLASCFSFYPTKNLGAAGEAGAVVTDDDDLAARLRRLRDHAQVSRHVHDETGFNYGMEGIQGAVLSIKLPHLDAWNEQRRVAAESYAKRLSDLGAVELPTTTVGAEHVWHLYVVRVRDRERIAELLRPNGVEVGFHYPTPMHLQPAFADLGYTPGSFPIAEDFAARCLSLPMFPTISDEQLDHVAEQLRHAVGARA